MQELPDLCRELNIQSPLFVTDQALRSLPFFIDTLGICEQAGLRAGVFSDLVSNPTLGNITNGVTAFKTGGHDGVIGFGGGSAMDGAKAIGLMQGQTRPLWDFEDVGDNWLRVNTETLAPVIAIPTTAGTGSEVGRVAVISDTEEKVKRLIFHPRMMPDIVVLDPQLVVGLPPFLTACTGMDALSHALEAYCAPGFHPMADGIACEAVRLIHLYLKRATLDGTDMEARAHMLAAATMGATAFQKGLGAMHALAHPLGAVYNSHHGLLNAILMPYVLNANKSEISEKIARLATILNLDESDFEGFLSWILTLQRDLSIPHTLLEIGIDGKDADEIGHLAATDPSAATNPNVLSSQEYAKLYLDAVNGVL